MRENHFGSVRLRHGRVTKTAEDNASHHAILYRLFGRQRLLKRTLSLA